MLVPDDLHVTGYVSLGVGVPVDYNSPQALALRGARVLSAARRLLLGRNHASSERENQAEEH